MAGRPKRRAKLAAMAEAAAAAAAAQARTPAPSVAELPRPRPPFAPPPTAGGVPVEQVEALLAEHVAELREWGRWLDRATVVLGQAFGVGGLVIGTLLGLLIFGGGR